MCCGILEDQAETAGESVYGLCASRGGPSSMFTNRDCMWESLRESQREREPGGGRSGETNMGTEILD